MNITCPKCGLEDTSFVTIDENGSHYECQNCDHTWVNRSQKLEEEDEE